MSFTTPHERYIEESASEVRYQRTAILEQIVEELNTASTPLTRELHIVQALTQVLIEEHLSAIREFLRHIANNYPGSRPH